MFGKELKREIKTNCQSFFCSNCVNDGVMKLLLSFKVPSYNEMVSREPNDANKGLGK
jgi:hypothetical protein